MALWRRNLQGLEHKPNYLPGSKNPNFGIPCDTYVLPGMDEAVLVFTGIKNNGTTGEYPIYYSGRYTDCHNCQYTALDIILFAQMNSCAIVSTKHPVQLMGIGPNFSVTEFHHFGERGVYGIQVAPLENLQRRFLISTVKEPVNPYLALIYLFVAVLVAVICSLAVSRIIDRITYQDVLAKVESAKEAVHELLIAGDDPMDSTDATAPLLGEGDVDLEDGDRRDSRGEGTETETEEEDEIDEPPPKVLIDGDIRVVRRRQASLDTFRGLVLALTIFISYGGGGYWIFQRSPWDGLRVADTLLPIFLFISGVCCTISLQPIMDQLEEARVDPNHALALKLESLRRVNNRGLLLFLLGVFLNKGSDLRHFRIPGPLQCLAFAHFYVASGVIVTTVTSTPRHVVFRFLERRFRGWQEVSLMMLLPLAHSLITYLVAMPGCPRGYLGPGGRRQDDAATAMCTGGSHKWVDILFFTENHIDPHPSCSVTYDTGAFDSEGIVGSLNAAFLFYIGMRAGRSLLRDIPPRKRILSWLGIGVLFGLGGGAVCDFSRHGGFSPINRNMWSLSFIGMMTGINLVLLSIFHYVCDIKMWWTGAPFSFMGRNSLLIYAGHEILRGYLPFALEPASLIDSHGGAIISNSLGTLSWLFIACYLHKKHAYFKV